MKNKFYYLSIFLSLLILTSCFKYNGIPTTEHAYILIDDYNDICSYEEYLNAEEGEIVTVIGYIQAITNYDNEYKTLYLMDDCGGYVINKIYCPEELAIGTKIKVVGIKNEVDGRGFIKGACSNRPTYKILSGNKIYEAILIDISNIDNCSAQKVRLNNLKVIDIELSLSDNDKRATIVLSDEKELNNLYIFLVITDYDEEILNMASQISIGCYVNVEGFIDSFVSLPYLMCTNIEIIK